VYSVRRGLIAWAGHRGGSGVHAHTIARCTGLAYRDQHPS
jgi:hypothetical protein